MELVDLSHSIVSDMPQWPGDDQPLCLHRRSLHGADSHMSSALELGCHVGTHIDAPLHFLDGQQGLHEMPVNRFVGRGVVVRAGDGDTARALTPADVAGVDLAAADFVLFATGWDRHWGLPRYYREWSWLSPELATLMAGADLKGVGLDTPSLDPFGGQAAHDICAAAGMVNVENLAALERLPDTGFTLFVLPLKLHATEASPVRAVAWIGDR
jgi:arylformamidase